MECKQRFRSSHTFQFTITMDKSFLTSNLQPPSAKTAAPGLVLSIAEGPPRHEHVSRSRYLWGLPLLSPLYHEIGQIEHGLAIFIVRENCKRIAASGDKLLCFVHGRLNGS